MFSPLEIFLGSKHVDTWHCRHHLTLTLALKPWKVWPGSCFNTINLVRIKQGVYQILETVFPDFSKTFFYFCLTLHQHCFYFFILYKSDIFILFLGFATLKNVSLTFPWLFSIFLDFSLNCIRDKWIPWLFPCRMAIFFIALKISILSP